MAPLFPRCDYEHWLIVMDKPGGENATKDQMIDCYIQTLARVLGSEEEAKKKIYNVSCHNYFGFGCEIDEETSNKLEAALKHRSCNNSSSIKRVRPEQNPNQAQLAWFI
ncbi:Multiple organellar RNA editing factor 5 [Ranunculus cassubicifolius]